MEGTSSREQAIPFRINLIVTGILFSVCYWVLESVRDVVAFEKGTILERIFFPDLMSLWMRLLIVFVILLFSAYLEALKKRTGGFSDASTRLIDRIGVGWAGLAFGMLYWFLETVRDVYVFHKGSFLSQLLMPDPMGLWMRLLAVGILLLFGLYVQSMIQERERQQKSMMESHARAMSDLRQKNQELTGQVTRLQNEIKDSKRQSQAAIVNGDGNLKVRNTHLVLKHNIQNLSHLFEIKSRNMHSEDCVRISNDACMKLYAVSLIHSQIFKDNRIDRINITQFTQDLAGYLSHSFIRKQVSTRISKGDVFLSIKQGVPCALLLNELVYNAFQHGFSDGESGTVHVSFEPGAGGSLTVKVEDTGRGFPQDLNLQSPSTAGLRWASEVASSQLGGELVLHTEGGTKAQWTFTPDLSA